jgi:hypothetical protein
MNRFFPGSPPRVRVGISSKFALLVIGSAFSLFGFSLNQRASAMVLEADNDSKPSSATEAPSDSTLQQLELEREVLQKKLMMLNEDIQNQFREFEKLDTDTADLKNQESSLEDLNAIIRKVGHQLYRWNIELEAEQRIKVVEPASRRQGDDAATKYLEASVAGLFGFCLALVLVMQSSRRPWPLAIGSGLLLGGLSAATVMVLVPVHYEAVSLIKVQRIQPVVIQNARNGGADEGAAYDIYKKTQLQLLKSNFVLARAARRSEVVALQTMQEHKADPVGFLERNLIVDYPGDAELMRVAFRGTHRDDLPIIVNAIADSYMNEIVNGDQIARLKQRDLLDQHYHKNQEEFRNRSEKFKMLSRQIGASSSEGAQMRKKLAEQLLETLVQSRINLEQQFRDVDIRIAVLKERAAKQADGPPATPVPAAGDSP